MQGLWRACRTGATAEPDYVRLNNGALLPILGTCPFAHLLSHVSRTACLSTHLFHDAFRSVSMLQSEA